MEYISYSGSHVTKGSVLTFPSNPCVCILYTELITLADHLRTRMYLIKDTQLGQPYNIDPECSMYCEYPLPLCCVNGLSCFYI